MEFVGAIRYKPGMVTKKRFKIETLSLLALLLGAALIGFSPIFVRLSHVDPSATAFWRVALAVPFFWVWAFFFKDGRDQARLKSLKDYKPLVFVGIYFALDLAFWHWSIQFTTVANATLLSNLQTIVVAAGSVVFFKDRLTTKFWLGLVLALVGAGLLAGGSVGEGRLLGDGLAVATAFFYGIYILSTVWLRRTFRTATVMIWTGIFAALALIPVSLLTEDVFFPTDPEGWLVVFGLAFFCQFLGQGLITYGLAHLPAAFSAVALLLQPVVAAAAAWVFFAEILGFYDFAGAAAILAGIIFAKFGTEKSVKG